MTAVLIPSQAQLARLASTRTTTRIRAALAPPATTAHRQRLDSKPAPLAPTSRRVARLAATSAPRTSLAQRVLPVTAPITSTHRSVSTLAATAQPATTVVERHPCPANQATSGPPPRPQGHAHPAPLAPIVTTLPPQMAISRPALAAPTRRPVPSSAWSAHRATPVTEASSRPAGRASGPWPVPPPAQLIKPAHKKTTAPRRSDPKSARLATTQTVPRPANCARMATSAPTVPIDPAAAVTTARRALRRGMGARITRIARIGRIIALGASG